MTKAEWRKKKYNDLVQAGFHPNEAKILRDRGNDLLKFLIDLKAKEDTVVVDRVLRAVGVTPQGSDD
jgi:hypothetical protein